MTIAAFHGLLEKQSSYQTHKHNMLSPVPTMEGITGFKDALSSKEIMTQQAIAMNQNLVVTDEQALKVAKDMMEAFYTQCFKTLFQEIKSEEDETFSMDMTKDIFVEQLAKTLAQTNITPTHRRIADSVLSKSKNAEEEKGENSEVNLKEAFEDISKERGVDVIT